jgi:hypothetical protein
VAAIDDEEDLKRIASMKELWESLAKKGLATGKDERVTEASRRKGDIDEEENERKKEQEITDRIVASGDKEAIVARLKELPTIWARRRFRICEWQRVFPARSREVPNAHKACKRRAARRGPQEDEWKTQNG